jgi:hypothetical protein
METACQIPSEMGHVLHIRQVALSVGQPRQDHPLYINTLETAPKRGHLVPWSPDR